LEAIIVDAAARSDRTRARRARQRATALCGEARSLRAASERAIAAILFQLESSPTPLAGAARGRQAFVLRLVRLPLSVGFARRELGRWLAGQGVEDAVARDISVAFTEACANAVEHPVAPTRQLFEIYCSATSDDVAIDVRDYGCWSLHADDEDGGRGLDVMHALMDGVDVERRTTGTSVRMWKKRVDQPSPSTSMRT
jgi:anti-sigma regulatory factor (Ser/Thr protein kinase)